jgi:hypothetical protein
MKSMILKKMKIKLLYIIKKGRFDILADDDSNIINMTYKKFKSEI